MVTRWRSVDGLPPEALAWIGAVRTAAASKGLVLRGRRAEAAVGLGLAIMFGRRIRAAGGDLGPFMRQVEPLVRFVGLTLAEVEAVGVA